jgi:hypothetical protein
MSLFDLDDEDQVNEDEDLSTSKNEYTSMPLILEALDLSNFTYYQNFGSTVPEQEKNWSKEAFPCLRWLSCVGKGEIDFGEAIKQGRIKRSTTGRGYEKNPKTGKMQIYGKGPLPNRMTDNDFTIPYLIMVNEVVNQNFWDLNKYNQLQFLLMCCVGQGTKTSHNWLPMPKTRRARDKIEELFLSINPSLKHQELKILKSKYDIESITALCKSLGYEDKKINEITKALRNNKDDKKDES